MLKKKLLVILGAGSSLDMGMPSVKKIDARMKVWSHRWAVSQRSADYFQEVQKQLIIYNNSGSVPLVSILNFERVLGEMVALMNWTLPPPFGNSLSTTTGSIRVPSGIRFKSTSGFDPAIEIGRCIVELLRKLASHMRDRSAKLDLTSAPFAKYRYLFRLLSRTFDVGVYNLNYDTVVLSALPSAYTGFSSTGQFAPNRVHQRQKWGFIYHLHGSVHHSLKGPMGEEVVWQDDLGSAFDDGGT